MFRVGLTGGIGSGKSTVATVFELLGVPVFYADQRAKDILLHPEVKPQVISLVGQDAYHDDGSVHRKYIAGAIFSDAGLLRQFNEIVHPAVRKDFLDWSSAQKAPYVIQEAAILFESGAYQLMDAVIMVWAPEEERITRVVQRDGGSREDVLARIRNQMPDAAKQAQSDYILNNDGQHPVIRQALEIHRAILHRRDKT